MRIMGPGRNPPQWRYGAEDLADKCQVCGHYLKIDQDVTCTARRDGVLAWVHAACFFQAMEHAD